MVLDGTEFELIEACRRGEPEGFRALFDLHKDRVYSIALHFANDESSALDIAQDTFLKLFSSSGTFRGEGSFEAWLYRIVVNCCFDQMRERRRLLPFIDRLFDGLRSSGLGGGKTAAGTKNCRRVAVYRGSVLRGNGGSARVRAGYCGFTTEPCAQDPGAPIGAPG
jgi:hypothetical protein